MQLLAGLAVAAAAWAALAQAGAPATVAPYVCDAKARRLGLPSGAFNVSYFHGPAGEELAAVPVDGKAIVLSSAPSADGAKYAGDHLVWWSKGDGAIAYKNEAERAKTTAECRAAAKP
jgi:membrane-bound inhibitor of C-type lysozyme